MPVSWQIGRWPSAHICELVRIWRDRIPRGRALLALVGARQGAGCSRGVVVADELQRVGDALDEIVLANDGHRLGACMGGAALQQRRLKLRQRRAGVGDAGAGSIHRAVKAAGVVDLRHDGRTASVGRSAARENAGAVGLDDQSLQPREAVGDPMAVPCELFRLIVANVEVTYLRARRLLSGWISQATALVAARSWRGHGVRPEGLRRFGYFSSRYKKSQLTGRDRTPHP